MPSKQAIIDNIDQYSARELADYIKDGIVTFDELCQEAGGDFRAPVRKEVKRILEGSEEEDWQKAQSSNTEEGYMSFLQTYPDSEYAEKARAAIRQIQQDQDQQNQQNLWDAVNKRSIPDLNRFIQEHPEDPHCKEARRMINQLQAEEFLGFSREELVARINEIRTTRSVNDPDTKIAEELCSYLENKRITTEDILKIIQNDHNILKASVILKLISEGHLTYDDFKRIGIDHRFIRQLAQNKHRESFATPPPLVKINKVSTEVYFWGIPSSGKSCALGAILSVANNGNVALSMECDNDCQGYGYMTRLSHLFKATGEVGMLPEGTPTCSTYEMGFDLVDEKGKSHPITFIDLAGELVRCMYKNDAQETLSPDEVGALDTLTNVLKDNRSTNRKIHFFVLEYGGESRQYEGLTQSAYLAAALRYIQRTKIFEKETDAIYLMVTKTDKTGLTGQELGNHLAEYIENNYKGFYQGLENICRKNGINGGKVDRIPFSLGEVCFQDYCLFNGKAAENVVRKLLARTKGFNNGKLQKGINFFKR